MGFFNRSHHRRRASRTGRQLQAHYLQDLYRQYEECKRFFGSNDQRCTVLAQQIAAATQPEFAGVLEDSLAARKKRVTKRRKAVKKATKRTTKAVKQAVSKRRSTTRKLSLRRGGGRTSLSLTKLSKPVRKAQTSSRAQNIRMGGMRRRGGVGMQLVGASSTYQSFPDAKGMSSQAPSGASAPWTAPMDYDTSAVSDYDLDTSSPSEAYDTEAGYSPESYASENEAYAVEQGYTADSGDLDESDYLADEDEGESEGILGGIDPMVIGGAVVAAGALWWLFGRRRKTVVTVH